MKISQKGFISPLLALITFLLIGGGAYVYMQKNQTNQPVIGNIALPQATSTAQTPNSQTTDWKTYSNTKYNYSIKYPKDFYITFDSFPENQSQSFWLSNFKLNLNSFIGMGHPSGEMLIKADVYDSSLCQGAINESSTTEIDVGGTKVKRIDSVATDGGESESSYRYIVPKTDKNCFVINLYPYPINAELLQKSDLIISTFKFNP